MEAIVETDESDRLTIPQLAHRLGYSVDRLRLLIRRNPRLAGLTRRLGPTRFVRAADVPAVAAILAEPPPPAPPPARRATVKGIINDILERAAAAG